MGGSCGRPCRICRCGDHVFVTKKLLGESVWLQPSALRFLLCALRSLPLSAGRRGTCLSVLAFSWDDKFLKVDLIMSDRSDANLNDQNLRGASLAGASLAGADLSRANLSGANLSGARLAGANLTGADLSRANLSGANLSGADLTEAILDGARYNKSTLLGDALNQEQMDRMVIRET